MGIKAKTAKATHLFSRRSNPITISITPSAGRIYPVALSEPINSEASPGNSGIGIKFKNLFRPIKIKITASKNRMILVNVEFIRGRFWLVLYSKDKKIISDYKLQTSTKS